MSRGIGLIYGPYKILRESTSARMRTCQWCGKKFKPKKKELYCSVECVEKENALYRQKKQCRTCRYMTYLANNTNYSEIICGYMLKTGKPRNCEIDPCEKYEKRGTNEDFNN